MGAEQSLEQPSVDYMSMYEFRQRAETLGQEVETLLEAERERREREGLPPLPIPKELPQSVFVKSPNTRAVRKPWKLPPIGETIPEIRRRITAVEASVNAYPKIYKPGWGLRLAIQEFIADEERLKEYNKLITDVQCSMREYNARKALDVIFIFILNGLYTQEKVRRGYIVGIYDEEGRLGKVERHYNLERLADLMGIEPSEQLEDAVINYPVAWSKKDRRYLFENFVRSYGDFKNSSWQRVALSQ